MKVYLFIAVWLFTRCCFAQNMVRNNSFEETLNSFGFMDVDSCVDWHKVRNTPDYFNVAQIQDFSIPANFAGYQPACDGKAYMGVVTYYPDFHWNYREIIAGTLDTPLTVGTRYYVSFKTSLAISTSAFATMATNKIGALFTNNIAPDDSIQYNNLFSNFAHIYADSVIRDTTNWVTVFGSFVADSAYRYIKIGNFFDDNNIDYELVFWAPGSAYYYVDDVRVSTDSVFAAGKCGESNVSVPQQTGFVMPSAFTPNGDNVNDFYKAVPDTSNVFAFRIYNRWGEKVFETFGSNAGWNGKYKGEPQPSDVYVYYIEVKLPNGKTEKRNGSFTLLR